MPKRVPYSVANYDKIVNDDFYFVDKTRFIRNLEYWEIPLFLRPRRFGKSLWCSILECYYDINRREQFDHLFGNTDIGRNPTKFRNSFSVMRFSFASVDPSGTPEQIRSSFNAVCRESYKRFIRHYKNKLNITPEDLPVMANEALNTILSAVEDAELPPVYIIIDEYDNFTNQLLTEYRDDVYHTLTTGDSFLSVFYRTIKDAVGFGSVGRCFITGVLPVTMDDLTSGFNITSFVTLEPTLLDMAGFTKNEVHKLVSDIFADNGLDESLMPYVLEDLQSNYDGYRLLPKAPHGLYNSSICNFYLNQLIVNREIPLSKNDQNLSVDIKWLKRLAGTSEEALKYLEKIVLTNVIDFNVKQLEVQFNSSKFFNSGFFPASLYYLGLLTWGDDSTLCVPNMNVQVKMTEYYNEVSDFKFRPEKILKPVPEKINITEDDLNGTKGGGITEEYEDDKREK